MRKASLYYHFPQGKEELVTEALERLVRRHGTAYREALRQVTVTERLEVILRFVLEDEGVSGAVVDSVRFLSEERQAHVSQLFLSQQYDVVKRVLDEGIEDGSLRPHDTSLAAWMFLGSISELGRVWDKNDENFPKRVISLFISGVKV